MKKKRLAALVLGVTITASLLFRQQRRRSKEQ